MERRSNTVVRDSNRVEITASGAPARRVAGARAKAVVADEARKAALPDAAHLLDLMPGMWVYVDADLLCRYANRAYAVWRGRAVAELPGCDVRDLVDPASLPVVLEGLIAAIEGEAGIREYDDVDETGAVRMQVVFRPDADAAGRVRGVLMGVTRVTARPELWHRIQQTEAIFAHAFTEAPFGMFVMGEDGFIARANRALGRILGRPAASLAGMSFTALTHPDDVPGDMQAYDDAALGRSGYRRDKRYLKPDGSVVHCRLSVSMVRDAAGRVLHCVGQVEDETGERAAARQLQETHARLSLAMEVIHGGFWHLNLADGRFEPSPALIAYVEGPGNDVDRARARDAYWYDSRRIPDNGETCLLAEMRAGRIEAQSTEYRLRTWSGVRWVRSHRRLLRGPDGSPQQIVGVIIDQTDERARRRAVEAEADTDLLTGLLNRRGLRRRLSRRRLEAERASGVLVIDMDRFKAINDRFGHAAGDAVLAAVGHRLHDVMRDHGLVARIGGDEFVMVLAGADTATLDMIAARAAAALAWPLAWNGGTIPISASIGGAELADMGDVLAAFDDGITRADAALYRAKDVDDRAGGRWRIHPGGS